MPVTKVVAIKNMQAGKKELTIDYGSDFFTGDVTCECGAPNCRKVAVPSMDARYRADARPDSFVFEWRRACNECGLVHGL